ncbi:MAG: saccharopine dehydrogenase NADP-binding domain-containing protein [Bacteroidota bacterium]|nr:saccharopine dehydrogenase NADP-binding domain-containing protein [Bacteroidota bacterium]
MVKESFLLYGANGYTGQLIAKLAKSYGLSPILGGRNESKIRPLAEELKLPYRIIDLNETEKLHHILSEVKVVLHTAGPFNHTAKQMIEACIATNTHYLDITGEIGVFEMAKRSHKDAVAKNITIMPGVGFDVVPTDCMALFLKNKLPDAINLKLAFASIGGGYSHGTAITMAEGLGEGGAVREDGKIISKPLGHKGRWIDFGVKKLFVMTIPWGDVSTAFHTTAIPNIETYTGTSPKTFKLLKYQRLYNWLLKTNLVRNYVKRKINAKPAGPNDEMRLKSKSLVWGEVENLNGQIVQARFTGPEGYTLTAHSSLIITKKVLNNDFKIGYQTPANAYGEDLVLEIPHTHRELI